MSHDNHDKSDTTDSNTIGKKDYGLIKRVGFKMKHESVLEPMQFIWDLEMSTKTLLALSRHRVGVSLTMRSTRYTTSKNKGRHSVQDTDRTKPYLDSIMKIVDEAIAEGLPDDELSLLLPQAYIYRGQITMNGRSFKHFLDLRLAKGAHFQIRQLAEDMLKSLPEEYREFFEKSPDKDSEKGDGI